MRLALLLALVFFTGCACSDVGCDDGVAIGFTDAQIGGERSVEAEICVEQECRFSRYEFVPGKHAVFAGAQLPDDTVHVRVTLRTLGGRVLARASGELRTRDNKVSNCKTCRAAGGRIEGSRLV